MDKIGKKDRSAQIFILQCLAVSVVSFMVHFFGINVPMWAYVESLLLIIYGFTPEWLAYGMEYVFEVLTGLYLLIYFYIRLMFNAFFSKDKKKNLTNKNHGSSN